MTQEPRGGFYADVLAAAREAAEQPYLPDPITPTAPLNLDDMTPAPAVSWDHVRAIYDSLMRWVERGREQYVAEVLRQLALPGDVVTEERTGNYRRVALHSPAAKPPEANPDIIGSIDAALVCMKCGGPLGDSPSADFCGPACQHAWYEHPDRVTPLTDYNPASWYLDFHGDECRFNAAEEAEEQQPDPATAEPPWLLTAVARAALDRFGTTQEAASRIALTTDRLPAPASFADMPSLRIIGDDEEPDPGASADTPD